MVAEPDVAVMVPLVGEGGWLEQAVTTKSMSRITVPFTSFALPRSVTSTETMIAPTTVGVNVMSPLSGSIVIPVYGVSPLNPG